ncbi:MAG: PAC2 family protein [Candidatus Nitrosotenuis sp.]
MKAKNRTQKKANGKTLLLGFPGNGLIGTFTISYVISYMQMKMVGDISYPDMPPTVFVENGEIISPVRIYKKDDIYAIISDVPIYPEIANDFVSSIAEFCVKNKIGKVIVPSGVDTQSPDAKDIVTYGLGTDPSLDKIMYENDIPKFIAGSIIGTDATVIMILKNYGIPLLMLYTSCHPFFPDPQASISAITSLAKVLKIQVDTTEIQKRIDYLRIQHRSLMQETLDMLSQHEKQLPSKVPPIYR